VTGLSHTRHYRFFTIFSVLILAFSLTSAGILNGNMAIRMNAYATKSQGSSGGDSSDGGGGSKGTDSSSGGGGSNDKGGDNSGGGSDNGDSSSSGETGGDNNPTTEEPTPTLIAPPPPPPTCEQGSTSPECSNVPEPPGPVDCSTSPNDPSCNTTPGPVDCNTNPNDPSCSPQPPVDCKINPDDPSCTSPPPVDCKANPTDASCITQPVDCTTTPDDPKCNPDCTKNPDDPKCNPDCTKNPDDPRCQPCPPAGLGMSCPPVCKTGEHYDPVQNKCIENPTCPKDQHFDSKLNKCVPNPSCKKDERYDPVQNKCVPIICPIGTELVNGKCQQLIRLKLVIHTVVKNSFSTKQPTFLLLLDTAQLCQLAGDTQCVAKQNQFNTLNLVTKLDSTGKTWSITGQVENRVSKIQRNVQITAHFYDSKGNNVGGPYKGTVNPTVLKGLQLGAFSMKPSTSIMKGTPTFLRLEYQSTTTS
jgi:hypothetical protein